MSYGEEILDDYAFEFYSPEAHERCRRNSRMDGRSKHPFAITCRKCGSNRVKVIAFEWSDLELKCKDCGFYVDCGIYDTEEGDYSE